MFYFSTFYLFMTSAPEVVSIKSHFVCLIDLGKKGPSSYFFLSFSLSLDVVAVASLSNVSHLLHLSTLR